MHTLLRSLWGPRLCLLLLAAWRVLALGGVVDRQYCSLDSECGSREECRKAVVHGVAAKVKTCQCHKYVFANGDEPRCIAHNWRTLLTTILMTMLSLAFVAAQIQYIVAYREHMTDPPLRLGETRLRRAVSLRTLFLAFSTLAAISATSFFGSCILTIYMLGSSLHAFGAASAFLVVVCIWVRVAAKLHDPAGSTKKALYQLAFALDGSGIGLYLAIFFALPTGAVVIYFLLKGSWDHAFQCGVLFVLCGLILTSLAAKLLVAWRMHQYEIQKNGLTAPPPKAWWSLCPCFRRHRAQPSAVAVEYPEANGPTEEKIGEAERRMVRERRQALQGDLVASVSAESILSRVLSDADVGPPADEKADEKAGRRCRSLVEEEKGKEEAGGEEEDPRGPELSYMAQTDSGSSQEQDASGPSFLEHRVRIIQWEAWTLGKRVITSAATGMFTFVFAMPYGPWCYSYMIQMVGVFFGGVGLLVANANVCATSARPCDAM